MPFSWFPYRLLISGGLGVEVNGWTHEEFCCAFRRRFDVHIPPATAVRAESVDMAWTVCLDLLTIPIEEVVVVEAWMSGYFDARASNTVLDPDKMDETGAALGQFCQDNPDTTVMRAVEQASTAAE